MSGGNKKIILYDSITNNPINSKNPIKNDNIFEIKDQNNNYIKAIVYSDNYRNPKISYLEIPNDRNGFDRSKEQPFKGQINSRICFQFNSDYIFCNEKNVYLIRDLISKKDNKNIAKDKFELIKGSYWNGININREIIALTSNKSLPKSKESFADGEDKIIFYHYSSKKVIKSVENYSFAISQNNLALMPRWDNNQEDKNDKNDIKTNKILLCACAKYKEEQKNGILLLILEIENKIIKTTEKFYEKEIKNFQVYSLCPISKSENPNKIFNTEQNKSIETEYFLVGGFDLVKKQGLIKIFKVNYNRENFENTEIEFVHDIENITKEKDINNNESKKFEGFKGHITYITQSRDNEKILFTCSDGNVYLLKYQDLEFLILLYTKNFEGYNRFS